MGGPGGLATRILAGWVYALAGATTLTMVLGAVGYAYPWPVRILTGLVALLMLWRYRPRFPDLRPILAPGWHWAALALLAALLAVKLFLSWAVAEYYADVLSYHLPIATNILRHGTYRPLEVPGSWHVYMDGYPKALHLLYAWGIAVLGERSLHLIALSALPAMALSVYAVARRVGASPGASLFVSPLAVVVPVAVVQAHTLLMDNLVAALLCALAALAVGPVTKRSAWGVTLGAALICGSFRFSAAPVALLAVVVFALRARGQAKALPRPAVLTAAFCALVLPHYLGNFWHYGNPVYPYALGPLAGPISTAHYQEAAYGWLGLGSAPGWRIFLRSVLSPAAHAWESGFRLGGWGSPFVLLVLPAQAVCLGRRQGRLLVAALWLSLGLTPMFYWLRYSLAVCVLGFACLALALTMLPRLRVPIMLLALLVAGYTLRQYAFDAGYRAQPSLLRAMPRLLTLRSNPPAQAQFITGSPEEAAVVWLREKRVNHPVGYVWFAEKHYLPPGSAPALWREPYIVAQRDSLEARLLAHDEQYRAAYLSEAVVIYSRRPGGAGEGTVGGRRQPAGAGSVCDRTGHGNLLQPGDAPGPVPAASGHSGAPAAGRRRTPPVGE